MRTTPIPVTVGIFEARREADRAKGDDNYEDGGFEAPTTTTVTRMATRRGPIPVTVSTFEAYLGVVGGGLGTQSAGPYIASGRW